MSRKNQQNQRVRSTDALSVLAVLCLVCYAFVYVIAQNSGDNSLESAKIEMESLTTQIMGAGMKPLQASRGLASTEAPAQNIDWVHDWNKVGSEGKIGKDPWGQPFHYLVIKKDAEQANFIIIISNGPNGELETPVETITQNKINAQIPLNYIGDDFGLVRAVP